MVAVPKTRHQRILRALAAALASGSMFQTCETRLRDAFVFGSRDYFLSLFNPQTASDLFVPSVIDVTP